MTLAPSTRSLFRSSAAALSALLAVFFASSAAAQKYPERTVRLIVPFAPAGGTDIMARSLAQRMAESTGRQFVVENRPGGNAIIGTEAVAKAAPDGYTLLVTTNIFTINPWLYPDAPFNVERDFAPITLAGSTPNLLAAHPSIPANTVRELVALARARPGHLTIAAAGLGTPSHLAAELLRQSARIDLLVVHYKGTGASLNDVVGGQVAMSFGTLPGLAPFVKVGRLRALAVSGLHRAASLPEVPTVAETLPGFEVLTWYGLFAPAGTPREIIARLHGETVKALASPDVNQRLAAQGFQAEGNTPEQFIEVIRRDLARWQKVVAEAKIRAE
jgi:tripartite-type tricarboxylate transporter receptor subunit TctC